MPETDSARMANCGLNPDVDFSNREPLQELKTGDVFKASDFPVKVTQITNADGNGRFSGEGLVPIGWILHVQFQVEFTDILLNTDKQMIDGKVKFKYDETWGNILDLGSNNNQGGSSIKIDITVDFVIPPNPEFEYNDTIGVLVIYDLNGEPHNVDLPKNNDGKVVFPVTIKDADGNNYEVREETYFDDDDNEQKRIEMEQISNAITFADSLLNEIRFKFSIEQNIYDNSETYITMYRSQKIDVKIQVEIIDSSTNFNMSQMKWKLNGVEINCKTGSPDIIELELSNNTLPQDTNRIEIVDTANKIYATLFVVPYSSPVVSFNKGISFNGEYFFDDGYKRHKALQNSQYYKTFTVKNAVHYASVLGINQGEEYELMINLDDFNKIIQQDEKFRLVIIPELPNKITINGQDTLIIDKNNINTLKTIKIKAANVIRDNILEPMMINVYARPSNEKVGMIEYYCADKIKKEIDLIYVKFADETNYPTHIVSTQLQTFLNTHSLNQLFMDITICELYHDDILTKDSIINLSNKATNSNLELLKILNTHMFNLYGNHPPYYYTTRDYYYITNLVRPGIVAGTYNVGFHITGKNGGVHVAHTQSVFNETSNEIAAHEFGHWIGLPHTFEATSTQPLIPLIEEAQGKTLDNFMDYNIRRKRWLKIQLLNTNRDSN
jgi:hypothetical protein